MDRAALAAKVGPKFLEDAIALQENAPEPVRILGIVGRMFFVVIERNRRIDFVRP